MKKLVIALALALALVLAVGYSAAFAADPPTTVTMNWSGTGTVGTTVTAGNDANTTFSTGGSSINGTFTATDQNNNPYGYQVDSYENYLNASVGNGYIEITTNRTDSYAPMYGSAGQTSYSFVGVDGGTASMADRVTTNYAKMVSATYTYQLTGGHNIVASADYYQIMRNINAGNGDGAGFSAGGSGSATLDCMSSEASGVWPLTLGRGAGCYTDANFNASGSGGLSVGGTGHNSVTFNGMGVTATGDGSAYSASLSFVANWLGTVSVADYSLTVQ